MKALGILLLILLAACTTTVVEDDDNGGVIVDDTRTVVTERVIVADESDGRVITAITGDASQSILVTVDNIELYNGAEWVTIASDEDTYDLQTSNELRLAGDAEINPGTYTQLRVDLSSVYVGNSNAQLPAEKFVVPVNLAIPAGETTVVVVDIHGDESLQLVNGRYVFTPVITVHACVDATVIVDDRLVTTSCQIQPYVETYQQEVTGRVIVNTVYREQPVIRIERYETTNNTVVINNTYRETIVQDNDEEDESTGGNTTTNATVSGSTA